MRPETPIYDRIGLGYSQLRRPDPRIAAAIAQSLGAAQSVLNVGAGAGSYEPTDRPLLAVEPSWEMLRQRPSSSAPAVQATAEALPFPDQAFGATLAVLTVHHWSDRQLGLEELRRVARDRIVILTMDPDEERFWLIDDYFPEILDLDRRIMPRIADLRAQLGAVQVIPVPIPHDCTDGFLGAYWRRPEAYLNPAVRGAISAFSLIDDPQPGLDRLARDLRDGAWRRRYGHLAARSELDLGYRLVVAQM